MKNLLIKILNLLKSKGKFVEKPKCGTCKKVIQPQEYYKIAGNVHCSINCYYDYKKSPVEKKKGRKK